MFIFSFAPSVITFKDSTSLETLSLYSYTSAEKLGVSFCPSISNFTRSDFFWFSSSFSVVVSSATSFFGWASSSFFSSLVTFIVYTFSVPSSALTTTFISLFPTFKFCDPVPEIIFAFGESFAKVA